MSFNKYNIKKYSECDLKNISSQKIGLFIKGKQNRYTATAYIRLLSIFNSISFDNLYFSCIIDEDEWTVVQKDIKNDNFNLDVIIIQRDVLNHDFSVELIEYCKLFNIKIIYELDDDLINIEKTQPEYEFYKEKSKIIRFIMKNADKIVVSTECLKQRLNKFNNNIIVINNTLIDSWGKTTNNHIKNSKTVKIGYMGATTHEKDLNLIKETCDNVKKFFSNKEIDIVFEMIGGSNKKIEGFEKIEIPNAKKEYPYFVEWLKNIADWDIALAPLEDNNINKSKSEIKYLEYSALGIPAIYSPVGAYKKHIIHNKTGILVKDNSPVSWEYSLKTLIKNESLRKKIQKNSKIDIEKNYSMQTAVNKWKNILNQLSRNPKIILNIKINEYKQSHNNNKTFIEFLKSESYDIIEKSGLFDENWYLTEYEDVKINKIDPIYHYLNMGEDEGCKPNLKFNEELENNYGLNNFVNYILFSHKEIDTQQTIYKKRNFFKRLTTFKKDLIDNISVSNIINSINNISIIIPIYNAYDDTKKCIESVLTNTTIPYELILINDNSSDKRIKPLLKKYSKLNNVTIINNTVNNGFTKNVNFGIKISKNNDVVLLNSDTIVSSNWLQKILFLAHSNKNIGTITPFSNASDISIPVIWKGKYPTISDVNKLNLLIGNLYPNVHLVAPTGNGYCLFIKRETIIDVGLFDEESFGQGYGEETDFTMRAKNNGWLNCRLPSTFIYHKKSASFSLEKADSLKKEHKQIILDKHPTVFKEWDKFYHSNDLKNILETIKSTIENIDDSIYKKSALFITTIKNNEPFIEDFNILNNMFNILFITYNDNTIKLWYKSEERFILIEQITSVLNNDCGTFNQFYINLIAQFNVFDIFVHQTIIVSELPKFLKIFPLVLFDKLGLIIHYVRPRNLNNYSNSKNIQNLTKPKIDFKKNKCVVYTAITGGYDNLIEPEYIDEDFDYICFTDNPKLESNIWEIRLIDTNETNIIRKAREYKILPHKYLSEYDYSFWIDGGFKIVGNLKKYVHTYLKDSSLLTVKHIRRDCIYEESKACLRLNKDDEKIIKNQIEEYKKIFYPEHNGLIESGFLFRIHNDEKLIKLMNDWYNEIKIHSFRDQLSFNYVSWKNQFKYDESDIIIWKNQFIEHAMKHNK